VQVALLGRRAGGLAHVAATQKARSPAPVKTITPHRLVVGGGLEGSQSSAMVWTRKR